MYTDPIYATFKCEGLDVDGCHQEIEVHQSHLQHSVWNEGDETCVGLEFRCPQCGKLTELSIVDHIAFMKQHNYTFNFE